MFRITIPINLFLKNNGISLQKFELKAVVFLGELLLHFQFIECLGNSIDSCFFLLRRTDPIYNCFSFAIAVA